jgi:ABC-type lipoprotein export system ATPase subunit
MTILMVTHDQYIAQHSHRIVHLTDGRITREEKVEEKKNAADELQRRFPRGKEE